MPLAMSSFWQWFFLFLIWVPLVMLWATALVDIFRRPDLGGGSKVLWVLIIFVIPWIGSPRNRTTCRRLLGPGRDLDPARDRRADQRVQEHRPLGQRESDVVLVIVIFPLLGSLVYFCVRSDW